MAHMFAEAGGLTWNKLNHVDFSDLGQTRTNESADFPPFDNMDTLLESPFDDWPPLEDISAGMPNNNPFGAWPTNAETGLAQPALTAASSGTQSEIDEIPILEDVYTHGMPSIAEVNFDLDTGSPQTNRRSLPPGFFGNIDFSSPTTDEWQAQMQDNEMNNKPSPAMMFTDPWQSNLQVPAPNSTTFNAGRPMARSVGPANAPSGDIIKQLFPDMDVESEQARTRDTGNVK